MLKRFWFEFQRLNENETHPAINFGCGVTAFDLEDALNLVDEKVFYNFYRPLLIKKIENVDISKLDQGHVIPNMKSPNERGIWFPLGYE